MYGLDLKEYLKWQELEPPFRQWVKLWLDGAHAGTHLHWRLSPLSVIGLAKTWQYLSRLESWRFQQEAIIRMADRRRKNGLYNGQMPNVDAERNEWNSFFSRQLQEWEQVTVNAVAWHRQRITESTLSRTSWYEIWAALNELWAVLVFQGYSPDDLFNRVKDGVIDAANLKRDTDADRLLGFLEYFSHAEPRTYVVWTKVWTDAVWSNAARRRFTTIRLQHPWDLIRDEPTRVFLLGDDDLETPMIVNKVK
jgi:hypothetical protein